MWNIQVGQENIVASVGLSEKIISFNLDVYSGHILQVDIGQEGAYNDLFSVCFPYQQDDAVAVASNADLLIIRTSNSSSTTSEKVGATRAHFDMSTGSIIT